MTLPAVSDPSPGPETQSESTRDPYRGAVLALLAMALFGTIAGAAGGYVLGNQVLLEATITLLLSTGVLTGVAMTQAARAKPAPVTAPISSASTSEDEPRVAAEEQVPEVRPEIDVVSAESEAPPAPSPPAGPRLTVTARLGQSAARLGDWIRDLKVVRDVRVATVEAAAVGTVLIRLITLTPTRLEPWVAALAAVVCLLAAGLAGTAVRYLSGVDASKLPEGPALARGARIVAWMAILAAAAIGLQWGDRTTAVQGISAIVALVNVALCYGLFVVERRDGEPLDVFPLDNGVLSVMGTRMNVVGSILDAAERQLGIDLRSTWALTVVRRSVEPLVIGLCFVGWLSTSFTVIGVAEQGLVERLGVPLRGAPLQPGLHLHWPWPIDDVFRIPVQRVQALTVGHEGQESGGPEDVLWARQHAANEYTLLLGNGRDLITVDAALQYRIADARAWRYHSQNPGDALRAIAYRAVMRTTVNRTLADALSENVVTTTARMRAMVQQDADALGLGVEVLGFTVGGMHPPVAVSPDYQAVVSAELRKVTAVVNAEAFRNTTVPYALGSAVAGKNRATAEGAQASARATGEAWSFVTLQSQYLAAPDEYFFRRRLETLEKGLALRRFIVLDFRFQRDGGELWMMP
jgi:regulator of protease activity HflC (stomatin/prohibitin superfamily)